MAGVFIPADLAPEPSADRHRTPSLPRLARLGLAAALLALSGLPVGKGERPVPADAALLPLPADGDDADDLTTGTVPGAPLARAAADDAAHPVVNRTLKGDRLAPPPPPESEAPAASPPPPAAPTFLPGRRSDLDHLERLVAVPPVLPLPRPALPSSRTAPLSPTQVLAYAAPPLVDDGPFRALFAPPIAPKAPSAAWRMHPWAYDPLPASVLLAKEQHCLAEAIYFEARGESDTGQAAVAQVVLNRVKNPAYPDTICTVVYQNSSDRNRCQFSFACDGRPETIRDAEAWVKAQAIAGKVTRGEIWLAEIGDSTHYHATYVRPGWRSTMQRLTRIGVHVFYRTYKGGWI